MMAQIGELRTPLSHRIVCGVLSVSSVLGTALGCGDDSKNKAPKTQVLPLS